MLLHVNNLPPFYYVYFYNTMPTTISWLTMTYKVITIQFLIMKYRIVAQYCETYISRLPGYVHIILISSSK